MADRVIQRNDTAARWKEVNPVLAMGEIGIETDGAKGYKIGDGVTRWNDLAYPANPTSVVQDLGNNENAVPSQKLVTEKLSELSSEVGPRLAFADNIIFDKDKVSWDNLKIRAFDNLYNFDALEFEVSEGVALVLEYETKQIVIKYALSWLKHNDIVLLYNRAIEGFVSGLLMRYYYEQKQSNIDKVQDENISTLKTEKEKLDKDVAIINNEQRNFCNQNIIGTEIGHYYHVSVRKGDKITISSEDGSVFSATLYGFNSELETTGYYAMNNVSSYTLTATDDHVILMWAKLITASNIMVNFGVEAKVYSAYLPTVDFFSLGIPVLKGRLNHIYANQMNMDIVDLSYLGVFKWNRVLRGWANGVASYSDKPNLNVVTIEFPLNDLVEIEYPLSAKTYIDNIALVIYSSDKVGAIFKMADIIGNTNQYVTYSADANKVRLQLQPFVDSFQSTHVAITFAIDDYYIANPLAPPFSVTRKMLEPNINAVADLKILMSPQICLMDGDTQTIYTDNFSADTNDVSKKCSRVGFSHGGFSKYKKFKGGVQITGNMSDPVNPHPLDFYFYDNNEVKQGAITNVRVVSSDSGNGSSIQVLCIGDSLTDDGRYIAKTAQRFANDGMSVEFVGTKGDGSLSNPHREGNSGWNTKAYVTQQTFNGRTNPFYNPSTGTFDFAYYCNNNGYNPDIVLLALGTNEITVSVGGSVPTVDNFTQYWDTMLSSIKAFDPNIKVAIWLCPIPCQLAELELNEKIKRMQVVDKLLSKYNYKGYFFLPIYPIIGAYDYNISDLEVHDGEKYKICTDILHFGDAGHQKISNALFASLKYWATKL